MLKMSLQSYPESDLASRPQKCWKWLSRGLLRVIWPAEPRNAWNESPEASCKRFDQKCAKRPSRDLQRAIGLAGPGNAWNELPEVDWERFDQPSPEMFQMNHQRHSESDLPSRAQKCLKWASRNFLRAIWRVSGWASGHRHYLICICVCVCVCLCLACMCIYVSMCAWAYVCMYVCTCVYAHRCAGVCVCSSCW